jgi:hypothetical protein
MGHRLLPKNKARRYAPLSLHSPKRIGQEESRDLRHSNLGNRAAGLLMGGEMSLEAS